MNYKWAGTFCAFMCICCALQAESPTVAEDNSASSLELISLGMPAYDRIWDADDYSLAADVLKGLSGSDATRLPRKNSQRSREMYERMIAFQNLDSAKYAIGASGQAKTLSSMVNGEVGIFMLYASATSSSHTYDSEVVDFSILLLETARRLFSYVDDLFPSSSSDNPSAQAGLTQMRTGLSTTFGGLISVLGDKPEMRLSELVRFAIELKDYVRDLHPYVLPGTMMEIQAKLVDMVASETDAAYRGALSDLLALIQE